ncbi:MAG TPA: hypothetical protein VKB79_06300 [Bryobacteraceae bacterium]|nr:hypothetical protein [Bryobacteraceae bacterium]
MTVQLDWPPDVVGRLTEQARRKGLSLDAYLLEKALRLNGDSDNESGDDAEKRRERAEAAASIRELRAGVKPDPEGWTLRDYVDYGRR